MNQTNTTATTPVSATSSISLLGTISLGVGGMMGAGVYALLGLAAQHAGNQIALAFLLGAGAAAFSVYSYARLGAAFPGSGGPANFTVAGFGPGWISGSLNIFQYLGYLVTTALCAAAFAEYANALFDNAFPLWALRACSAAVVIVFSLINLLGTRMVGRASAMAMGLTILVLLAFSGFGALDVSTARLTLPENDWHGIIVAAGILYINYQGFGDVTNASGAMKNPRRELARGMFGALAVVTTIYVMVSLVAVGVWPIKTIDKDSGHVLASIAGTLWGKTGLLLVGISALLATAAAVNATVFAAAHIARDVAQQGTLPKLLAHPTDGIPNALIFSTFVIILMTISLPLAVVGQAASLMFLLVYSLVTIGHWRIVKSTGANRGLLAAAIVINLALFSTLFHNAWHQSPVTAYTVIVLLIASGLLAVIFRHNNSRGD